METSDGGGGGGAFSVQIDALLAAAAAALSASQTLGELAPSSRNAISAATHDSGSHAVTEALRSFNESWTPILKHMGQKSGGLSRLLNHAADVYTEAEDGNAAALREVTRSA